jgi:hypothetical protein
VRSCVYTRTYNISITYIYKYVLCSYKIEDDIRELSGMILKRNSGMLTHEHSPSSILYKIGKCLCIASGIYNISITYIYKYVLYDYAVMLQITWKRERGLQIDATQT